MADSMTATVNALVRHRHHLMVLARVEQQLVSRINAALEPAGYRIDPLRHGEGPGTPKARARLKPKRLQCPYCPRRFAHPLPMARHVTATHGRRAAESATKPVGNTRPGRRRKTGATTPRRARKH